MSVTTANTPGHDHASHAAHAHADHAPPHGHASHGEHTYTHAQHGHSHAPACAVPHPFFENPKFRLAMSILEKVVLVALAIFAAYTDPTLFFSFFGGGFALGIVIYFIKPKEMTPQSQEHGEFHSEGGGCSQGFMEQLTGIRLPPPLGLAANVAIAVCHIDHHSHVFVPLIGLNAGMWVASLATTYVPKAIDFIKERCSAVESNVSSMNITAPVLVQV